MMTNDEIRELIASYSTIANETAYSDNTRAAARRKVAQLESELQPEEPKVPEVNGIGKWFKQQEQ
jgi:hypothetical protein